MVDGSRRSSTAFPSLYSHKHRTEHPVGTPIVIAVLIRIVESFMKLNAMVLPRLCQSVRIDTLPNVICKRCSSQHTPSDHLLL